MLLSRYPKGAALILAAVWSFPLQSAVLQLAPIPIEVESPQSSAVLSLGNRASTEAALQVRVFRWFQEKGEDRLVPTQDVVVSPPIASVPAGQTLTVRVVRVSKTAPVAEETYRIWVDELPSNKTPADATQLRILMRYSVPVFFGPPKVPESPASLSWRLIQRRDKKLALTATNPAGHRMRISGLQLISPDGKQKAMPHGGELAGYALAGQYFRWTLKPQPGFPVGPAGGTAFGLTYETETGSHRDSVSLSKPR